MWTRPNFINIARRHNFGGWGARGERGRENDEKFTSKSLNFPHEFLRVLTRHIEREVFYGSIAVFNGSRLTLKNCTRFVMQIAYIFIYIYIRKKKTVFRIIRAVPH